MAEGNGEVVITNGIVSITIHCSTRLVFFVELENIAYIYGGALIRSAYVNGTWKRSNAKIEILFPKALNKYTYEMWRSYYESTGVSAKYLNQGDEGSGIQG